MKKKAIGRITGVRFSKEGLIPAVAQDAATGEVLMLAYMNKEALRATLRTRKATYFSRSRRTLWVKGESSGHVQIVKDIRLDCDGDTLLLRVRQVGGAACHTGMKSCFHKRWDAHRGSWKATGKRVFDPEKVYGP